METTKTNPAELIAQTKRETEAAKEQILKTFGFVPEDRLQWTPTPTARTALQIVAHCGAANTAFAALIRGEGWSLSMNPAEAVAQIRAGGSEIETRDAAIKSVEESTAAVIAALDRLSPDQLNTSISTAFGPFPFAMAITFPGHHMDGHSRQIDYLQTIWGDQDDH